jgi:FRG domain
MSTIRWSDFKSEIQKHLPKERQFTSRQQNGHSLALFRGHASDQWTLETTLERRTNEAFSIGRYMQVCGSARRYIGNYVPSSIQFNEDAFPKFNDLIATFPNYEYLAFLRHHGFPSPFLDWTESPYVAAFFALRDTPPTNSKAARIYIYISDTGLGRGYCTSSPHIKVLGPFVSVHERHAIQQCWYTIAVKKEDDDCIICPHEDALAIARGSVVEQDLIDHYDIDLRDREEALTDLYGMNITAYTLFRSLDSLIETTSCRLFSRSESEV